jgi:hypothetical protein
MSDKLTLYNEALRLVGDLRLVTLTDDVEARYALDDAWNRSVLFVASQANWPHAYASAQASLLPDTSSPGYTKSYTINNANWLRTVMVSLDEHFAVGAHYHQALGKLFLNTSAVNIFVRYIDKTYLGDAHIATWSEMFCSAVSHRLAFEVCERLTQDPQKAQSIYALFVEVLNLAKSQIALETSMMMISPSQWAAKVHNETIAEIWEEALRMMGTGDPKMVMIQRPVDAKPIHQIMELAWRGATEYCLSEGYWNFATKTELFITSAGDGVGYQYSFAKPADWLRTADIAAGSDPDFRKLIDYRDEGGKWYVNSETIYVRYVSSDYAQDDDATSWPENFKSLLACYLASECVDLITGIPDKKAMLEKEYEATLARALSIDASDGKVTVPKRRNEFIGSIWSEALRMMGYDEGRKSSTEMDDAADRVYRILDTAWDRTVRFCLTEHYWNFATTTTSILGSGLTSLGFTHGFNKPSNWMRTVHVSSDPSFNASIEYRDQGGRFYADANPLYLRYVSTDAVQDGNASTWPEIFSHVVACRLAYECVTAIMGDPNLRTPLFEAYTAAIAGARAKDAADQSLIVPKRRNSTISAIWKEAIRLIGFPETKKANPETEITIESIYQIFDDAWVRVVRFCMTEALWNFATKTEEITASVATPIPGWQFTFDKPANWLRTIAVANTSTFDREALYHDEGGKIYANHDTLYIRFISSQYGADNEAPNWPEMFCRVLAHRLAYECSDPVSGDPNRAVALLGLYKSVVSQSKNKDAMDQAQMFPKTSNWLGAMRGGYYRQDRGPLSGF